MLVNIATGADTVAVSMCSLLYLPLKHPAIYQRLQSEILNADFSTLLVPYAEACQLPYLDTVIRERFHYLSGSCFPQERYVPKGGLNLPDGSHVSEDTAIGFNADVLNRNKKVRGPDAEDSEWGLRAEVRATMPSNGVCKT